MNKNEILLLATKLITEVTRLADAAGWGEWTKRAAEIVKEASQAMPADKCATCGGFGNVHTVDGVFTCGECKGVGHTHHVHGEDVLVKALERIRDVAKENEKVSNGPTALFYRWVAEAALDGCDCDCHEELGPCVDCKGKHSEGFAEPLEQKRVMDQKVRAFVDRLKAAPGKVGSYRHGNDSGALWEKLWIFEEGEFRSKVCASGLFVEWQRGIPEAEVLRRVEEDFWLMDEK